MPRTAETDMAQQLRDARASGSSIRIVETAFLCFAR
jgi:hypothetical protein